MNKLSKYFLDHQDNPMKLLEFVWFTLCYYFGRRGREGWRSCTTATFVIETDEDGVDYLEEGHTREA